MIQGLDKFGKVELCKQIDGMYHIKITDGFNRNMINTMACVKVILDALPEFPIVHKCHTDTGIFHLILKK